jgi:hypothetical protein
MIGNVKAIVLKDGTKVDLSNRVGEFFQVEIDKEYFELVHQDVFFKETVGAPEFA